MSSASRHDARHSDARSGLPPASLLILNPSGQRSRVLLEPLPFVLGRHTDNNLVVRDNRVSRTHSRIFAERGHYVIEDLDSRHGTWVNGVRISRHVLRNSDRIEFGVRDSFQLTFSLDHGEINRIIGKLGEEVGSGSHSNALGPNNLAKLR